MTSTITIGMRLRNEFNKETFIFTHDVADASIAEFDVHLDPGGSGGGNAMEHIHPHADERFTVHRGAIAVTVNGISHHVAAGESFTVPMGASHCFRNAVDDKTELTIRFSPSGQQLRFFANFATIVSQKTNWFKSDGAPHFLLMALILSVYRDCYFVAGPPFWLQRAIFGALAPLARLRGYSIDVEPLPDRNPEYRLVADQN